MTRSRSARRVVGRWALLLLLALGSGRAAYAQHNVSSKAPAVTAPKSVLGINWVWILLGGTALGVLGARLLGRRSASPQLVVAPLGPLPVVAVPTLRPVPCNVPRENREVGLPSASARRPASKNGRPSESVQERLVRREMEQRWRDQNPIPAPADWSRGPAENRPATPAKTPIPTCFKPALGPAMSASPPSIKSDEIPSSSQTIVLTLEPTAKPIDSDKTDNSLLPAIYLTEPSTTESTEITTPHIAAPVDNIGIKIGQDGWSVPPTKPYSYEAPSE